MRRVVTRRHRCDRMDQSLMKIVRRIWLLCSMLPIVTSVAMAEDKLKVSIGQMDMGQSGAGSGERAGIFKKHGISLENFRDPGLGRDAASRAVKRGADRSWRRNDRRAARLSRGAPVKIIGASFTGVGDGIAAFAPTVDQDIGGRDRQSYHHSFLKQRVERAQRRARLHPEKQGVKAKPRQTGGLPATFTQVMRTDRPRLGHAAVRTPRGCRGEISIIANWQRVPSSFATRPCVWRSSTNSVANNPDLMKRLMRRVSANRSSPPEQSEAHASSTPNRHARSIHLLSAQSRGSGSGRKAAQTG